MNQTELLALLTTHWDKPSSANYYNDTLKVDILWFKTWPEEVAVAVGAEKKEFTSLGIALDWACTKLTGEHYEQND